MLTIMAAGSEFWNLSEVKSKKDKIIEFVSSNSYSLVKFLYTLSLRDKLFTSEFLFSVINLLFSAILSKYYHLLHQFFQT